MAFKKRFDRRCIYILTPAMPNIAREAFILLVCAYLSLRYTTSLIPLWMIVFAHSLQGNRPTYIYGKIQCARNDINKSPTRIPTSQ